MPGKNATDVSICSTFLPQPATDADPVLLPNYMWTVNNVNNA